MAWGVGVVNTHTHTEVGGVDSIHHAPSHTPSPFGLYRQLNLHSVPSLMQFVPRQASISASLTPRRLSRVRRARAQDAVSPATLTERGDEGKVRSRLRHRSPRDCENKKKSQGLTDCQTLCLLMTGRNGISQLYSWGLCSA